MTNVPGMPTDDDLCVEEYRELTPAEEFEFYRHFSNNVVGISRSTPSRITNEKDLAGESNDSLSGDPEMVN